MTTVRANGIEIYYQLTGEGRRLLFINGTGGDLRQKPSLVEGPLAQSFELLAYDQRGLGRSGKPDVPYTMADYADDAAALLDAVGWERCAVIGVSFGGMVAQELALRHPERIERMVLCCTSSGGEGGAAYPLHELADLAPEERARRVIGIGDRRWAADVPGRDASRFEKIVQLIASRQIAPGPGEDPELAALGARRQLEARLGHDTWNRLGEIEIPTYLCGGRYDGISPPENMENIAARMPNAQLELFEGGHMFLFEDRSAFQKIVAFLRPED